ncbi:MAG: hypothetical protein ACM3JH_12910, partial [Acidithiobacillales bacterium]
TLDRVGASPSVFDPEKLLWMNAQYIARMPAEELLARVAPAAPEGMPGRVVALRAIELHRSRARTIVEMGRALSAYARDPDDFDADGMKKQVKAETPAHLERLIARLETQEEWSVEALEAIVRQTAESLGLSAARLIHPVRLALTGTTVGAPLFDVLALLGRETALRRLRKFVEAIQPKTPA